MNRGQLASQEDGWSSREKGLRPVSLQVVACNPFTHSLYRLYSSQIPPAAKNLGELSKLPANNRNHYCQKVLFCPHYLDRTKSLRISNQVQNGTIDELFTFSLMTQPVSNPNTNLPIPSLLRPHLLLPNLLHNFFLPPSPTSHLPTPYIPDTSPPNSHSSLPCIPTGALAAGLSQHPKPSSRSQSGLYEGELLSWRSCLSMVPTGLTG